MELLAGDGDEVEVDQVVGPQPRPTARPTSCAARSGHLVKAGERPHRPREDVVEREYQIPHNAKLRVENGQEIRAGDAITDGPINPQEYLETRGRDAVQRYLVKEVQKVYRSQGVTINDKHIEIIVRQMLRKVRIDQPGDSELLPFELIDRFDFEEHQRRSGRGRRAGHGETVLLGVTKASLNTISFLAAASFQETTRVLTEAAINGPRTTCSASRRTSSSASSSRPGRVRRRRRRAKEASRRRRSRRSPASRSRASASEYNPLLEDGGSTGPGRRGDRPRARGDHRGLDPTTSRLRHPFPPAPRRGSRGRQRGQARGIRPEAVPSRASLAVESPPRSG